MSRFRVTSTRGNGFAQRHRNGGIALVVLQPDVESRAVLLDEVVLEKERAGLAGHDDRVHIGDEPLEQSVPRAVGKIGGEVAADSAAEPLGLSYVQHLTVTPPPEVHTGPLRERVELPLEFLWDGGSGHGFSLTDWPGSGPSAPVQSAQQPPGVGHAQSGCNREIGGAVHTQGK